MSVAADSARSSAAVRLWVTALVAAVVTQLVTAALWLNPVPRA
jgi:hypothetical protein